MAQLNYYEGWTIAELLLEQKAAQRRASRGTTTETAAAGVKTTKTIEVGADEVLRRINYSLYKLDPTTYTLNKRITATKSAAYG